MGIAVVAGLLGCRATNPPPPVGGATKPSPLTFHAELGPITALAWNDPFLWIGTDRGLRRLRPATGEQLWLAPEPALSGHHITALAPAGGETLLVATEVGVSRLTETGGDRPVLAPLVALPGVTRLAAVTDSMTADATARGVPVVAGPPRAGLAWLGTEHGLFLSDGAVVTPVPAAGKNAISFLQADPDGRSAWVGLPGRGLLHVDRRGTLETFGPAGEGHPDFTEVLGMATMPNGTPFAVGRGGDGNGRLLILHKGAPTPFEVEPSVHLYGTAMEQGAPLVFASKNNGPLAVFTLSFVERGQSIPPDSFRFAPPHKQDGARIAAVPDGRTLPFPITARATGPGDAGLFFGTSSAGVARLGNSGHGRPVPPYYLPAGELAWKARALEVACLERDRCVIATGAGPGWIWDGANRTYKPVPLEAMDSPLMALAGDGGSGAVYFVAGDGPKGIRVARLSSDGQSWDPLLTIPVDTEGAPLITFATVSPVGSLWLAVRDRLPGGEEIGRGVIELQLPSGKYVHHRVTHAGQTHPPEMIPIPGDVRAVRFQTGTSGHPDALWFCTSLGVLHVETGKLTHWSENDGLASDSCEDLTILNDGTVWVATREGVARFDGIKNWIPFEGAPETPQGPVRWPTSGSRANDASDDPDGDPAAARAFVTVAGKLWAGTEKGIWPVTGAGSVLDDRSGLLDSDVIGLHLDRFGRLWVLGHLGLTVTDTFPLR